MQHLYAALILSSNLFCIRGWHVLTHSRGGFKAENLLGHITRKASSPLPSHPSPDLPSLPFALPSPPLEVDPSNPAKGSGGAL